MIFVLKLFQQSIHVQPAYTDLGAHCAYDLCKQQTFTPFECKYCSNKFCKLHVNSEDHECKKEPKDKVDPMKLTKRKKLKCKVKGCKTKIGLMLIKCPKCNGGFCANHRHCDLHSCPRDITDNKHTDNSDMKLEEIADNRWIFVKTELCKKWNKQILIKLQTEIEEQEVEKTSNISSKFYVYFEHEYKYMFSMTLTM